MGNWDEELVSLLPDSCKVYASAGAGFDWVDTAALAKKGMYAMTQSYPENLWRKQLTGFNSFRSYLLQCRCSLHRIRRRCRNLAHNLNIPSVFLVTHCRTRSGR